MNHRQPEGTSGFLLQHFRDASQTSPTASTYTFPGRRRRFKPLRPAQWPPPPWWALAYLPPEPAGWSCRYGSGWPGLGYKAPTGESPARAEKKTWSKNKERAFTVKGRGFYCEGQWVLLLRKMGFYCGGKLNFTLKERSFHSEGQWAFNLKD